MTSGVRWHSRMLQDYWFLSLPSALQDGLLAAVRQRRITAGKLLFAKGDAPCGLYALVDGTVRMGGRDEQRLAPCLEPVRPLYWFGEVSLFDGLPRTLDACSLEQGIFLQIPQSALDALLERHPEYRRPFAALLSEKLGLPWPGVERLQVLPALVRVAWRILLLGEGYGHLSNARRLIDLAAIEACATVRLTRESLVAVLQDLQQRKVIRLDPERLEVLDTDKLRQVANVAMPRISAPGPGGTGPASGRSSV